MHKPFALGPLLVPRVFGRTKAFCTLYEPILFVRRALETSETCCSVDIQDGVCCFPLGEGNHSSTAGDAAV